MSDIAIQAEHLSKRYRIGLQKGDNTLSGKILDIMLRPMKNLQELRKLSKFEDNLDEAEDIFWALKDVSFEVKQGEMVGIIGRNGAGKSTLLKILSRITGPTSGRAIIQGRVSSLLEVGTGFNPDLTGRENIYMSGIMLGIPRAEINRKFDEIVEFAGVEKFIDTPVKRYSSGMYVRLGFAVAAQLEPDILIVDEVLAVGDFEFQKRSLGKMGNIVTQEGRTVLFVSHSMESIARFCTRAISLENGRVTQNGPVHQVIANYLQANSLKKYMGERIWSDPENAPGDDVVRIKAVRAVNPIDRQVVNHVHVKEAFDIEIEFWVLKSGYTLDAGFQFFNENEIMIFAIGDFQNSNWHNRERPTGIHRSICHIPGNFLNDGKVRVLVAVATNPHTLHAIEENAITVQIIDNLELGGARGNYIREWPRSVVRPLLTWSFDFKPLNETNENN